MSETLPSPAVAPSRSQLLRSRTTAAHAHLDARIMAAEPFSSRAHYGRFLLVQHAFHRDIAALFSDPRLDALLPDLPDRQRLPAIEQDLVDLGIAIEPEPVGPAFGENAAVPPALGWLYVAEGSNLGAAILLKQAAKLGLDETFGARHLAGHPDGRGLHWRTFTTALDGLSLPADEEDAMVAGATAAFDRVRGLVERHLPTA